MRGLVELLPLNLTLNINPLKYTDPYTYIGLFSNVVILNSFAKEQNILKILFRLNLWLALVIRKSIPEITKKKELNKFEKNNTNLVCWIYVYTRKVGHK